MTNEELIQKVLNIALDRAGRQAMNYETEIANLNAQILVLNDQLEGLKSKETKDK